MNLDAIHDHRLWFESESGEVVPWNPETDEQPPIETHPYACSRFPLEVRTEHYRRRASDGHYGGDDRIATFSSSANESLVLALANGKRWPLTLWWRRPPMPLHRAVVIASGACERCMNALAYLYDLPWGYREGGPEWRRCGTECEMCRDMGFTGRDREGLACDSFDLSNAKRAFTPAASAAQKT